MKRFAVTFTVVFAFAYASWIIGSYAYVAAVTPADQQKFGIGWSLKLTNEGGYVVALLVGLIIANGFPRLAEWLKEAIRPELDIKIAIVILGAFLAVTAAGKLTLATSLVLRGIAAIVEAYLIYWAVVYYVARKMVRLQSRMGGPARVRYLDLRRFRRHRGRRRHPGTADRAGDRVLAGRPSSRWWRC